MESKPNFPSQVQLRTDRSEDEETSSLSDYDSEWTQVSGLEDDSDYPPFSAESDRPLSRTDTIEGSNDGDIWEGFIDGLHRTSSQSSEQARPLDLDATDEAPSCSRDLDADATSQHDMDETLHEEPESSFTGTLRAASVHSAASSLHASMSESQSKLRLSFPDPLSSREDLDNDSATLDVSSPPSSIEEHSQNAICDDASSFAEVDAPLSHSDSDTAAEMITALSIPSSALCILTLYIYGSATSSKWQIAERVIKHVLQHDLDIHSMVEDGAGRAYYFTDASLTATICTPIDQDFVIRVHDRTSNNSETESSGAEGNAPSVAILLLPSSLPEDLPKHNFYLPLITSSSFDFGSVGPISSTFSEQVTIDSAQYTWKKLDVPRESVITLERDSPRVVLDASALESMKRESLAKAFSVVLGTSNDDEESPKDYNARLLTNKWYTLAFLAATVLAVTIGGIQIRRSSAFVPAVVMITSKPMSIGTSSFKSAGTLATIALSANRLSTPSSYQPLATVMAKTTERQTPKPAGRGTELPKLSESTQEVASVSTVSVVTGMGSSEPSMSQPKARSWVDKFNLSLSEYIPRDLIVRPVDVWALGNRRFLPRKERSSNAVNNNQPRDSITSLSLRTVQNSLAVVSSKGKALKETASKDIAVIHEAIDELLGALGRQMNFAKDELRGANTVTRLNLLFRNERAKENARRIRHAGEHFIKVAGDRLRSTGEDVINKANELRHSRPKQAKRRRHDKDGVIHDNKMHNRKDEAHEKKRDCNSQRRQRRTRRARVKD